ncbi:MAG: glycoside hydrolase family 3 C-terminal domain-containing protein [Erysipelothrix sp.]|nr:glycoside hydrolase family 3 C-terminal domain-containing protein [Erysipelothrix sp.]
MVAFSPRAYTLLAQMTLDEKIGQLVQFGRIKPKEKELIRQGLVGSFLNHRNCELVNEIQRIAIEESRLGIPLLIGSDVIHGYVSTFPIPLAEACSWNLELIESSAKQAMAEAASDGVRWNFFPMVDITRDPRWGRIAEGAGEDPYYGSLVAQARVRGVQTLNQDGYPQGAACAKHYLGYGWSEGGRDYNTVDLSDHVLRTTVLPPFKACVDAGVMTFMSAFNDVLAVPASGNPYTIRTILKGEMGFNGFVVSDWESVEELIGHSTAYDQKEAALIGLLSGVDIDMHSGVYLDHLKTLVSEYPSLEKEIDDAVLRILTVKDKLGLFEKPYVDLKLRETSILNKETVHLTLEMARESIVLLKNDGSLPISTHTKISLIGPFGDDPHTPIGCWGAAGHHSNTITLVNAFEHANLNYQFAKGCETLGTSKEGFDEALRIAQESDVIVFSCGEHNLMSGENHNRAYLDLPGVQQDLFNILKKCGKPIITLLFTGRPLTIGSVIENSNAVLCVWHLGLSSGTAITETLLGLNNPSGKLVTTFPKTVGQIPLYYNHKNTGRPNFKRYIDCDDSPLFHFGYGLSYSTFFYDNLTLSKSKITSEESLVVSIEVSNTSNVDGTEIIQVYYRDLVAQVTRPVKELCAFQKIRIKAHETRAISFTIPAYQFGYLTADFNFIIEKGAFALWIGPNSYEGLATEFYIV